MKNRVIWIIDSLGQGGAEHLMPGILGHLDAAQFDLRVCALQVRFGNPIGEKLQSMGIPVDFVPVPHLRNPGNLPRLLRYLKLHQPHVVHTQLEFADTLGSLAACLLGIPSVSTLHVMPAPQVTSREYWRHRLMWWSLKRCSARVFAVSEGARQHYIQSGYLPVKKIQTLYNGIDLSLYNTHNNDVELKKRELNIPPGAPVLITVAYLRELKGIQFMLEALPVIVKEFPQCRYLIVGDGDYKTALQTRVNDLGLENNVIFTGRREDVPDLLAMSDVFMHPSLADALPTVLAEAMAVGKPIIASRVGGVPEMVEDGVNGLLTESRDSAGLAEACVNLLRDPARARKMGDEGLKIAREKFDIEKQCRQLEECYRWLKGKG